MKRIYIKYNSSISSNFWHRQRGGRETKTRGMRDVDNYRWLQDAYKLIWMKPIECFRSFFILCFPLYPPFSPSHSLDSDGFGFSESFFVLCFMCAMAICSKTAKMHTFFPPLGQNKKIKHSVHSPLSEFVNRLNIESETKHFQHCSSNMCAYGYGFRFEIVLLWS